MTNKIQYGFIIFAAIITIIGFLILIFSVNMGIGSANGYLRSVGGGMNTDSFRLIEDRYILLNITLGGIILFIGLSSLCFGVYKFLKGLN